MSIAEEALAYVTLGLLCGVYQLVLLAFPTLLFVTIWYKSWLAGSSLLVVLMATLVPINHKPQFWFLKSAIWKTWHKYFAFSHDLTSVQGKLVKGEKYLFWEVCG